MNSFIKSLLFVNFIVFYSQLSQSDQISDPKTTCSLIEKDFYSELNCDKIKTYKDWSWFKSNSIGNQNCEYYFGITKTDESYLILSSDSCSANLSVELVDENASDVSFHIDGKKFNVKYKTSDSWVVPFANAQSIKLIANIRGESVTYNIPESGSSAALRYLGLIK